LDSLVNFSVEVENVVATMAAANLKAHIQNPLLLSELVDKLPPQLRLDWALYARQFDSADISHLSDWLYELATAASSIVSYGQATPREEKKKPQRVSFHEQPIEYAGVKAPQKQEFDRKCIMCSDGHFVATCTKFNSSITQDVTFAFSNVLTYVFVAPITQDVDVHLEQSAVACLNCNSKHAKMQGLFLQICAMYIFKL